MQGDATRFQILLRENRRTFVLALPIVAGLVGQMLMGIADTVMVGRVGVVPLAACAFANTILVVPMVFGFGLLSAVSVHASHAHGAGRQHIAGESLRGGVLLALGMGLVVGIGVFLALPFLALFGQPDEVNKTVGVFFLLCAWSLLPLFVSGSAKNFCEALGRPWIPFWIMMAGVLLNVFLNWILILRKLRRACAGHQWSGGRDSGKPHFGDGRHARLPRLRALAECRLADRLACSRATRGDLDAVQDGHPHGRLEPLRSHRFFIRFAHDGLDRSCSIGSTPDCSLCCWHDIHGALGPRSGCECEGRPLARANRRKKIPVIVHGALWLTVCIMAVFAAGYLFLGNVIAEGFTPDASVRSLTVQLLVLAGVFQIFDGIQVVSSGALRGFADTKIPFLVGIVSYWIVALPVSWLMAFPVGLGAPGIWIGFVVGLGVAAVALCTRLLGKCRHLNVSPRDPDNP
jgi:MATE family multidrug resistance protein